MEVDRLGDDFAENELWFDPVLGRTEGGDQPVYNRDVVVAVVRIQLWWRRAFERRTPQTQDDLQRDCTEVATTYEAFDLGMDQEDFYSVGSVESNLMVEKEEEEGKDEADVQEPISDAGEAQLRQWLKDNKLPLSLVADHLERVGASDVDDVVMLLENGRMDKLNLKPLDEAKLKRATSQLRAGSCDDGLVSWIVRFLSFGGSS